MAEIEDLVERKNTFTFAAGVNEFLASRKYKILKDKGKISKQETEKKAEAEYDGFNKTQIIVSDSDKELKNLCETIKKQAYS